MTEESLVLEGPPATIWHGNALDVLARLPAESVHAVVTDPPYGLGRLSTGKVEAAVRAWSTGDRGYVPGGAGIMGAHWDRFVPPPALWDQVMRVLKPGGWLLSFAAPRTLDLMGLSIRLAGFEVTDEVLAWVFGTGMPKSRDLSVLIDEHAGAERPVVGLDATRARRLGRQGGDYETTAGWSMGGRRVEVTAPASEESAAWEGWAARLKPVHEPVLVARRPLDGPLPQNVVNHGAGALHIEAVRVPFRDSTDARDNEAGASGRWPGNMVVAHHPDCADECIPQCPVLELAAHSSDRRGRGDATRFVPTFHYQSKASAAERPVVGGVSHATVKPKALTRWLVDLVAVPGMTVLDPCGGSGTTVEVCLEAGVDVIAVEAHGPYIPLILERVRRATERPAA